MASPQKENGYTPIAHELLRAFIKAHLSGQQWETLMILALDSYGKSRKQSDLSISQIAKLMDAPKARAAEALKMLGVRKIVLPPTGTENRTGYQIERRINKDYDQWGGTEKRTGTQKRTPPCTEKRTVLQEVVSKQRNKNNILCEQESWFEKIWEEYPAKGRIRKKEALKRFSTSVKDIETAKRCAIALEKYIESKRVNEGYVQNAPTWFGDWESWENYAEEKTNGKPEWS